MPSLRSKATDIGSQDPTIREFVHFLTFQRGRARNTVEAYLRDVRRFVVFMGTRSERVAVDAEEDDVTGFVVWLRKQNYDPRSVARAISSLRSYFDFLVREGHRDTNPAREVELPKVPSPFPKALTIEQVERLLESVPTATAADIRDKALIEFLYATGARISEAARVDLSDVELEERSVRLVGKGDKARVVPFGGAAGEALQRYLYKGRPVLAARHKGGRAPAALFLNQRGGRMTRQGMWMVLKARARAVGLTDVFTPHVLRHSCATHMLEGGADIRAVQEILGHASLRTTQGYTKVTFSHIWSVYQTSHPRAG